MTDPARARACRHYWYYVHAQIQGRAAGQTVVLRYCGHCGVRQMAQVGDWRPARGAYAKDEHYAD